MYGRTNWNNPKKVTEDTIQDTQQNVRLRREEKSIPDEAPLGTPKINTPKTYLSGSPLPSSTESIVECLQNVSKTLAEVQNLNENDKTFTTVVQEEIKYL